MALRPGRIRLLAGLGMALFLGAILIAKPRTVLPPYALTVRSTDAETLEFVAVPERAIEMPLQAHTFAVVGDRVVHLPSAPEIEPDGTVRARCPRPADRERALEVDEPIRVGVLIGHADSTPSPAEAWEELQSEGPQRPTFRLLLAPLPAIASP